MSKFFLILSLLFLVSLSLSGQKSKVDKIILEDGSVIVGKIIKYEEGKEIIFKMSINGDTIQIDQSKITRIILDGGSVKKVRTPVPFSLKEKKSALELSTNFLLGNDYNGSSIGLSYFYSFSHVLNFGLGISLDYYNQEFPASSVSTSLNYRGYFPYKKVQFFAGIDAGYGFARTQNLYYAVFEKNGGLMYHPYVGIQVGATRNMAVNFSFGYRSQDISYMIDNYNNDIISLDYKMHRLTFGINLFTYF